jgi:hypothetical protein
LWAVKNWYAPVHPGDGEAGREALDQTGLILRQLFIIQLCCCSAKTAVQQVTVSAEAATFYPHLRLAPRQSWGAPLQERAAEIVLATIRKTADAEYGIL